MPTLSGVLVQWIDLKLSPKVALNYDNIRLCVFHSTKCLLLFWWAPSWIFCAHGNGGYFNQNEEYLVAISATYTTLHTLGTQKKKLKKGYNLFRTRCISLSSCNSNISALLIGTLLQVWRPQIPHRLGTVFSTHRGNREVRSGGKRAVVPGSQ